MPVVADPLELELAVVNLVKNAFEAVEGVKGGRVRVARTLLSGNGPGPEARKKRKKKGGGLLSDRRPKFKSFSP